MYLVQCRMLPNKRSTGAAQRGMTAGGLSAPLGSTAARPGELVVMRRWAPEGSRSLLQSMPQLASELGHARPHIRPKPYWIRENWKRW